MDTYQSDTRFPPASELEKTLAQARQLAAEQGARLVYLVLFGSHLYGTRLEGLSDTDMRGLVVPVKPGSGPQGLHYTSKEGTARNHADDVDIDLWSVERLVLHKLPDGDIAALDLVFSPSHPACVLYQDPCLTPLFAQPLRLFNAAGIRAYVAYCRRQGKRYGLRGTRLGALRSVAAWVETQNFAPAERLEGYLDVLEALCASPYCRVEQLGGKRHLHLGGKLFEGRLRCHLFAELVRAELARSLGVESLEERQQTVDWKALSHALRSLRQMRELLLEGRIVFPLACRKELLAVKQGKISLEAVEEQITQGLEEIAALQANSTLGSQYDPQWAAQCVRNCCTGE